MRNSTFVILFFILLSSSVGAQKLTLLPQVGFERPVTKLSYNNLPEFRPLACEASRTIGARLDYKLKQGFGPFIGVASTRAGVAYSFTNAETGMTSYSATSQKMQVQFQAGLQASTKAIYFKKSGSGKPAATKSANDNNAPSAYGRCGGYRAYGHCGLRNRSQAHQAPKNKNWFVRIMPSAGLAVNPFAQTGLTSKLQNGQTVSTYNAGSFKTAVFTGVGLEFGSANTRHFTVTLNYLKGLGNNAESITTEPGLKPVTTNLTSKISGWNASVGIPFSFGKSKAAKGEKKKCLFTQYRTSCRRTI